MAAENTHPGYPGSEDASYVGTLNGVGHIYLVDVLQRISGHPARRRLLRVFDRG